MSNLSLKINLSKLSGASLIKVTSKSGKVKEAMLIPVDDANLFKGEKGVYLDLIGIETKEAKFNQSHFLKPSISKEVFESMTEEERKQIPIVGNVSKLDGGARSEVQALEAVTIGGDTFEIGQDDLPW